MTQSQIIHIQFDRMIRHLLHFFHSKRKPGNVWTPRRFGYLSVIFSNLLDLALGTIHNSNISPDIVMSRHAPVGCGLTSSMVSSRSGQLACSPLACRELLERPPGGTDSMAHSETVHEALNTRQP